MSKVEFRCVTKNDIEIRSKEDGSKIVEGYAMKWGELSLPLGSWYRFREKIEKGAFTDSIASDDQRALWSHDTAKVLGRRKNNTLTLTEDDVGLRFSMDLPNTTVGNDAHESVKRGDVDGVSFGFNCDKVDWDETNPDEIIRTVKHGRLFEISLVAFPAYEGVSEVEARSALNIDEEYKKFKELREASNEPFFNTQNLRKKLELRAKECEV